MVIVEDRNNGLKSKNFDSHFLNFNFNQLDDNSQRVVSSFFTTFVYVVDRRNVIVHVIEHQGTQLGS